MANDWIKVPGVDCYPDGIGSWPAVRVKVDYCGVVHIAPDDGMNGPNLYSWPLIHPEQWPRVRDTIEREQAERESDLDEFMTHYIACMLWAEMDQSDADGGEPFDRNYDESNIDEKAMEQIKEDCGEFLDAHGHWITDETCLRAGVTMSDGESYSAMALAGHDFWLTRAGHGVGFWESDRWTDNAGQALSDAARGMGARNPYVGDDGQIHYS